jgi:hypothetical protein
LDKRENLVTEIRECLNEYIEQYGNVNLAIFLKDKECDTYTFMISSPFLNLLNEYDAISLLARYFFERISIDARRIISRINVIDTRDPLLINIYSSMKVRGGISYIYDCIFQNLMIEEAILMESHED